MNRTRPDGRAWDEMRPVRITPAYLTHAEGSALIEVGRTRVICAVSVEDRVPPFLRNSGQGWVTAEYSMLPRSTLVRTPRESARGQVGGRTHEIQRLIGRSLRAVTDLKALGERSFLVDCDVLEADGGTRTASITGAYVALHQALSMLVKRGNLRSVPLQAPVAATSVGVWQGNVILDLCYEEDSAADVDFNVVMTGKGEFVEVQGTAEHNPFSKALAQELLDLAERGIAELIRLQDHALGIADPAS